jgi:adenylate kinase
MRDLNLIFLGPPGAGKGTQAERFALARGIPRISTGDILRDAVQSGTKIGRQVHSIMDRGELVSDEIMNRIVRQRLNRRDAQAGFVLDGFPRTVPQAVALDAIMDRRGPLIIVDIAVPESEIVRRLGSRMICADCGFNGDGGGEASAPVDIVAAPEGAAIAAADSLIAKDIELRCRRCGGRLIQRADDSESVIKERLRVYYCQTAPLVDYYRNRPTFRSVNGAQPPDRVAAELAAAIDETYGDATLTGGGARL